MSCRVLQTVSSLSTEIEPKELQKLAVESHSVVVRLLTSNLEPWKRNCGLFFFFFKLTVRNPCFVNNYTSISYGAFIYECP